MIVEILNDDVQTGSTWGCSLKYREYLFEVTTVDVIECHYTILTTKLCTGISSLQALTPPNSINI